MALQANDANGRDKPRLSSFDRTILDSLSAHIAILDRHGNILETNRAWQRFGQDNEMQPPPGPSRVNYLEVCDAGATWSEDDDYSREAARGLRSVMAGELDEFTMDYPCHSPTLKMWFYMRVVRIQPPSAYHVVVSHEDITPLKLAEETIRIRERDLEAKTQGLEEANTALKVILRQREEDKKMLEEKVVANVQQLCTPYIEKLGSTRLDARQKAYLDIINEQLKEIISPFLQKMSTLNLVLTPTELHVASLVKAGRATKEIAEILSVTTNAVDFHRKNIRKKLDLSNRKTNLRSYLLSLS
jgi:DNA-binding CsgD family transcriptional regulator/PAS domain-containing protein